MTKRRRGAPRGNRNALKHGFYSAAFQRTERQFLLRLPGADLSPEIELIRVQLYRFLEALNHPSLQLDIQTRLAALRAVSLSVQSILALARAREAASIIVPADLPGFTPLLDPAPEPPSSCPDTAAFPEPPVSPHP